MQRLRLGWSIGSIAIGVGGAVALAGSLLAWAVVHYSPRFLGIDLPGLASLTHRVPGTDLWEGKVALVVAAALLGLGIGALLAPSPEWRADIARVASVGAAAAVGFGIEAALRIRSVALDRYDPLRSDRPLSEVHLRKLVSVSRGVGILLVVAGGLVALAGAVLLVVRSRADRGAAAV